LEKIMAFRRIIPVLIFSIAIVGIGCNQASNVSVEPAPADAQVSTPEKSPGLRSPDVVYVPTPSEVVDKMLEIANVNSKDVLYDLGSGDGRIPITATKKFGIRATGIDINPTRIQEANANAQKEGVTDRVQFLNQDLFESDFKNATVVTLYLLPQLNVKLRPQLLSQLKPGSRIVSHDFDMGEWKPEKTAQVNVNGRMHNVYLWIVPQNVPTNLRSSSEL
jgi:hypothetical protein